MKKTLLALLAAVAILAPLPAQAAAPAAEQPPQGGILTGMPNPYTEYSTLAEMKQVLGFMPQSQGMYDDMTAWEFLLYMAQLKGLRPRAAREQLRELLARAR